MSEQDYVTREAVKKWLEENLDDHISVSMLNEVDINFHEINTAIDSLPAEQVRGRIERAIRYIRPTLADFVCNAGEEYKPPRTFSSEEVVEILRAVWGKDNEWSNLFAEPEGGQDEKDRGN